MSSGGGNEEAGARQSSSTSLAASRKRSRRGSVFDDDDSGSINSLFVVSGPRGGAISARSADAQLEALVDLVDDGVLDVMKEAWARVTVPADMYWSCPQHLYTGDATSALLRRDVAASAVSAKELPAPRIPHPRQLIASFYPMRVEALAARGYQPHRGLLPVALDRKGGKGSKLFNVLARWEADMADAAAAEGDGCCGDGRGGSPPTSRRCSAVARFVDAIPRPIDRNLYVLVDEECPVDPYFDVDFAYSAAVDDGAKLSVLQQVSDCPRGAITTLDAVTVERVLLAILCTLREEVERAWNTRVEECLVLTSSLQLGHHAGAAPPSPPALEELKLSFHVHFRLANRAAVESVKELHAFMAALRARLQRARSEGDSSDDLHKTDAATRAALLLECVDFGVYTRWRAFRLPYNVKASESHAAKSLAGGAGDELLAEQLSQLGISLPDVSVGSAAPAALQEVIFASSAETQRRQRYLAEKLGTYFRFLLPLLPGATRFASSSLKDFLSAVTPCEVRAAVTQTTNAPSMPSPPSPSAKDMVAAWVMEMASIVRDSSEPTSTTSKGSTTVTASPAEEEEEEEKSSGAMAVFQLLKHRPAATDVTSAAPLALTSAVAAASPFDMPMPPMPRSVRTQLDDKEVKRLLAEVFWCLAPEYGQAAKPAGTGLEASSASQAAVTPERMKVQFEESIRAYYVYQKQSKFCFRLRRTHKSTYAQLYLTFGSIKVRCYSNDCCDRCCVVPWEAPADTDSASQRRPEYPKFERLAEIRKALFPPLPAGELVRRYGTAVLRQQPWQ